MPLLTDIRPLKESPDFRRLWIGSTVSQLGQQMTAVTVSIQVYALSHSTFAVGLVGLCSLVPLIVFGLYGGAMADAIDRRTLALFSSAWCCSHTSTGPRSRCCTPWSPVSRRASR